MARMRFALDPTGPHRGKFHERRTTVKTRITLQPENSDYSVEVESDANDDGDVALRLKYERTYEATLTRPEVGRLIDALMIAVKPAAAPVCIEGDA